MQIRLLSPELADKAQRELHEQPNRIEKDLQLIQEWLGKQTHLKARTDDQWLLAFLRGCKYSIERTKEKLDMYYSLRTNAPEISRFRSVDPELFKFMNIGAFVMLPRLSAPDAPRVCIIRPGAYDADKYHVNDVLSVSDLLLKMCFMEDDNAVVAGFEPILDLKGVTLGHLVQMSPLQIKKMVVVSQVFVHNKNYEALYEHVPKDILPEEYGGHAGTIKDIIQYWKQKIEDCSAFLEEDLQYGSDESKRLGKPKTADEMFGVEGSFRQLQFD